MIDMNAEQLEMEALKLDPELRAQLAERLFLSLDPITAEEWRSVWIGEVERRAAETDADPSILVPAEEVFRKARARIK